MHNYLTSAVAPAGELTDTTGYLIAAALAWAIYGAVKLREARRARREP
jgi:hypothetical protein